MNLCAFVLPGLLFLLAGCQSKGDDLMVGTLERDRIELTADSNEPIVARHVRDGDIVTRGTVLLEQDPSRIRARHDQAIAARDQAAARLAEMRRGPRAEAIRETRARLDAARAEAANARAEFERVRDVFSRGLASKSERDRTEAAQRSADAGERAVREVLAAQLEGTTLEELEQAEAALAASEAAVRQAQIEMDRTRIVAPVDGIVDRLLYQVGERPAPATTVAVLLDSSRVFARVYVPEGLRARVRPGAAFEVAVDGVAAPLRGTVRWVSSDASFTPYFALTEHDRSRLSYLAEIDLENAANLPSGVPLEVRIPAGEN